MNDIRLYILDQLRTASLERDIFVGEKTLIRYDKDGTLSARAKIEVQDMIADGLIEDSVVYQDHKHAYLAFTQKGMDLAEAQNMCKDRE